MLFSYTQNASKIIYESIDGGKWLVGIHKS